MNRRVAHRSTHTQTSHDSTWHRAVDGLTGAAARAEKERVLDEAYDLYCELREQGDAVSPSTFCDRYPSYRRSLRRLLDVHEAFEQYGDELPAEEAWPQIGDELLGFKIHDQLGTGAIARVYLATEPDLGGRYVAIKVSPYGTDEAETLGKLSHPNIVPVYTVKRDRETKLTVVCMPYLGSATLLDALEVAFPSKASEPPHRSAVFLDAASRREILAGVREHDSHEDPVDPLLQEGTYVDGVVHLGIQLAKALTYTHEKGVLHRDLKPSNVLLTPQGRPMLLDFNLSCDSDLDVNRMGGTLPYMPPEQIRQVFLDPPSAAKADPRSDVFSLGVILYELLTGQLPFGEPPPLNSPRAAAGQYLESQLKRPIGVRLQNPRVDARTADVVERCLDLDPAKRPADAEALVDELSQHFAPTRRLRRWSARHRVALSLVTLSMLLLVAWGSWWLIHRPPYPQRQLDRGIRYLVADEAAKAIPYLTRALDADPSLERAKLARGIAYVEEEEFQAAVEEFDGVVSADSHVDLLQYAAYANARSGNFPTAFHWYARCADGRPANAEVLVAVAFCALQWHSSRTAASYSQPRMFIDKALVLDPYLPKAHWLSTIVSLNEFRHLGDTELLNRAVESIFSTKARGDDSNGEYNFFAARLLALAHTQEPSPKLTEAVKDCLRSAVRLGCAPEALELRFFSSWHDEDWFQDLRRASKKNKGFETGHGLEYLRFTPSGTVADLLL